MAAPKTPIALMDVHGTLDTTIPANRTNGYQWPKYQGPDGSTVSDDGMYYTNSTALSSACAAASCSSCSPCIALALSVCRPSFVRGACSSSCINVLSILAADDGRVRPDTTAFRHANHHRHGHRKQLLHGPACSLADILRRQRRLVLLATVWRVRVREKEEGH